jgi:hypothetical protein
VWMMVSLAEDLKLALDRVSFAKRLGLLPDPWQEDLLRSISDRVFLNCCRQSGKSTMTAIVALHQALYHPSSLILCLAPALRQSQELFGKVLGFYRDLDRPIPAQAERKLSLELENGSRIVTLPGTDKTIRGFSGAALLIVDEASRVADELYFAIRPMLAVSGGALMMLSTPHGKRGIFYEEWTGGRGWERYEVPVALAKSLALRGLTTATAIPEAAMAIAAGRSKPPVASRTTSSGASITSRPTSVSRPSGSLATE